MAFKVPKGKAVASDINVTPLIDVVLVLLIIFMVLTPIIINEMAVNLPEKTETVEQDDLPKDQLVVAVCEDGTIALNKRVMDDDALADQVKRRLRGKASKVVFVDAHPDAPYARVVQLMDMVRAGGADKLGMASLKTADEFRGCTPNEDAPEGGTDAEAPPAGG